MHQRLQKLRQTDEPPTQLRLKEDKFFLLKFLIITFIAKSLKILSKQGMS